MKRKIISLVTLCMVVTLLPAMSIEVQAESPVWDRSTEAFSLLNSSAPNSESNPYIIDTAEKLAMLAANVNGGNNYSGQYFKMTNNIVLNENASDYENWESSAPLNEWVPIGNETNKFSGSFDGNQCEVSGIYIDNYASNYQGLFGYVDGPIVKKLGVLRAIFVAMLESEVCWHTVVPQWRIVIIAPL